MPLAEITIFKCEQFSIKSVFNFFRRKQPSKKDNVKEVIKDINLLLESPDFNKEYLCNHLLNKSCQLTNSEYGFIGVIRDSKTRDAKTNEIHCEKYLKTLAITNIAWNVSSFNFYKKFVNDRFEFTNLPKTIFGISILNKKTKILNKYDTTRNVLPRGHPPIKRFLGVPIVINGEVMVYIGLCNKLGDYSKKDGKMIEKVLNIVGVTFYLMNKFNAEKSFSDLSIFLARDETQPSQEKRCPFGSTSDEEDSSSAPKAASVENIQMCTMATAAVAADGK